MSKMSLSFTYHSRFLFLIFINFPLSHLENIELSQVLQHVDVDLSACLNIVILPHSQLDLKFSLVNDQTPWIAGTAASSMDPNNTEGINRSFDLTSTNTWKVVEGCRLVFDLSGGNLGNVNPLEWKRQSVKAFVYEIFHVEDKTETLKINSSPASIIPYARINIISKHNSSSVLEVTYSCGSSVETTSLKTAISAGRIIASPTSVKKLCMSVQNGNGKIAYFESDASLIVDYLLEDKPQCDHRSYMTLTTNYYCTYSEVLVQIIALRINVTFTRESQVQNFHDEEDLSDFNPDPVVVLAVEKPFISSESLLEGRSKFLTTSQFVSFILYCTNYQAYENPSWIILLEPFDYFIWLGILSTGMFYAVRYKSIAVGFDVILIFLGQATQQKHLWNRLSLAFTLTGLLILNIFYVGEETMKVTAPLPKKQVEFAREIFELGYRTVLPDKQTAQMGAMLVKDRYLKLGIPWDPVKTPSSVISTEVNINKRIEWWWFIKMANNKWVLPFSDQSPLNFGRKGLLSQNRIHNVSCFLIKNYKAGEDDQHTFKRTNYYMTRGRLADKAFQLIQSIHHGGIAIIWTKVSAAGQLKYSGVKQSCSTGLCGDEESYIPLKFNSPVQIVFYSHLILCAFSSVAFLREFGDFLLHRNRVQAF